MKINKTLVNNLLFIVFGLVLLIITLKSVIILFLLIIYYIFLFKKDKQLFYYCLIISLVFLVIYIIFCLVVKEYNYNEFEGIITDIVYNEEYNKITVKKGLKKVLIYHYYENQEVNYKIGSSIYTKGINVLMEDKRVPMGFSNKDNLLSKRIISIISTNSIKVNENSFNIYKLKGVIYEYFEKNYCDTSKQFLYALVLGNTNYIEEGINEDIRINGISHLFAISGLHINFLIIWLDKIFLKISNKYASIIRNVLLGLYLFITGFSSSVTRAILMSYCGQINKKYDLKFTSLDVCSIIFIIMVFLNPFIQLNVGFQLSFLVTFIIILFSEILKKFSSITQGLLLSLISFVFTIPIVCNINNYINLLSPIVNIIFVYMITIVILPFSFIVSFIPILDFLYAYIVEIFLEINELTSKYLSLIIDMPNFNIIEIVLYYFLVYLLFKYFKDFRKLKLVSSFFFLFICCYYFKASFNLTSEVVFLDLKDGEAILINSAFNKYTVLIDTGDGTNGETLKYLKKKGIRKLDYLILTHNHQDHNGEAMEIINEIKVNNIIVSAYDNSRYRYMNNTMIVTAGTVISKNDLTLEFINPYVKSSDENDNSLVIYTKLGNYKYLFLADASCKVLDNIAIDVDVVKGGHHGSKTSASMSFYQNCTPKYVILQTGRTRKYNFPNKETIDLLNSLKINILRTDQNATITIYYFNNFSYIKKMYN